MNMTVRILMASRWLAAVALFAVAGLDGCSCGPTPCVNDGDCGDGQGCLSEECVPEGPALCARCADGQACDDTSGECLGSCLDGYVWDGDTCQELTGCNICVNENRACDDEEGPVCGVCVDGFFEDSAGNCLPELNCDPAPAAGSIVQACADEGRECEDAAGAGADCGACLTDYILVDGVCEEERTCDAALVQECADQNQECVETPNGRCGDCLPGFINDAAGDAGPASCRETVQCADLSCPGLCNEATDTTDAFCTEVCTGPNNRQGVEDATGFCVECGTCDGTGEDGPFLQALFAGTTCVCKSDPGFYYDPGLGQTVQCDVDGDGWVRKSAQLASESSDTVLQNTSNCVVREITAMELRSESGASKTIALSDPVPLYEENRLDSQGELDNANLQAYGSRSLRAEELNSLTKACVGGGPNADYNANGIEDVDEFQGMTLGGADSIHTPFIDFTYFIELARGWYDDGTYVIAEKSRDLTEPVETRVPFVLPSDDDADDTNDYWRQCVTWKDPGYEAALGTGVDTTTHDFADLTEGNVGGVTSFVMGHHSQFKCMRVVTATTATSPPHHITLSDLGNSDLALNDCGALGTDQSPQTSGPIGGATNPSDAVVECQVRASENGLTNDDAIWGVVTYRDYDNPDPYLGGCVNECAEFKDTCPGYNPDNPDVTKCEGILGNYGQLTCGCDFNYGGPDCSFGCPGDMVLYEAAYSLAPRAGYWMCGGVTASDEPELYENAPVADAGPSGYTLFGGVPAKAGPTEVLCETDGDAGPAGCGAGYSLHPMVLR